MFEECRLEGDFTLSSGRKSGFFYDFDLLSPPEAASYVEQLVQQLPDDLKRCVDFVVGPAVGGIIPAFLVAFALKKPLVVVDKEGNVRGPDFQVGNYLIVDDVVTSFKSVRAVKEVLKNRRCLGVASYIFRGSYQDLIDNRDVPTFYMERKEQEE